MSQTFGDVAVTTEDHVAIVEIQRPPHNFFDHVLIKDLVAAFQSVDEDPDLRCIVLAAQGKNFCAGADFASADRDSDKPGIDANPLYAEAVRLFACKKPVVGAIHGGAIGGGLGLALVPDFRIGCPESRFAGNFVHLGIHPGFGLTHTLPRLIGTQKASLMFYTGRRIKGEEAFDWGLLDVITTQDQVRPEALKLAHEIAQGAPLAMISTRTTMRGDLAEAVRKQTDHEFQEQTWLFQTEDHKEGIAAVSERRPGVFKNR